MRVRHPLVVSAAVLALAVPSSAAAEEPPFLDWASLLPAGSSTGFEPSSENDCKAGRSQCVDSVIREMTRRFDPQAESCDHDAIFALSYLRTTEEYRRTIEDPTFFEDTAFVNHEDAVFAAYYFDAYDDWRHGRLDDVPPAWRIAFRAADDGSVSAAGNMFLGMNAHIQRDLPFVFEAIGMAKPDGTTRKTDHDRVNEFLNRVQDDLIPEIARRFDPTIDDSNLPSVVDDMLTFQMVPAWRETAWRNAERLVAAPTQAARDEVAEDIEDYAVASASTITAATAYPPLLGGRAQRDAHCALHHDDE